MVNKHKAFSVPSISLIFSSGRGCFVDLFPAEKQQVPISSSVNMVSISARAYLGGTLCMYSQQAHPFLLQNDIQKDVYIIEMLWVYTTEML